MNTLPPSLLAAAAVLLAFPPALLATETEFTPALQFTTGLAGSQNKLTWITQPGARHRILSSDGLSLWNARAIVEAEGTTATWIDPTPAGSRTFYQVEPAQPEVFSVDPAVLSPGGVLVITGQCLPAGSVMVFEIEGILDVKAPIIIGPDGRMTVTLPAFNIIVAPGSGMAPHVKRAIVVGPGGATVVVIGQTFEATVSGFATYSPAVIPSASPSFMAINEKGLPGPSKPKPKSHARMAGGGDDDEDCDDEAEMAGSARRYLHKAKTSEATNNISAIRRTGALPGEVHLQQCDLELAVPAGPPLAFVRTYRSMNQPSSACGTGWDHGYNVYITPLYDSAANPEPTRVAVHTGDGRVEVMHRRGAVYVSDGAFREGRLNPDTSFTLTFADQSQFIFCPLVGAPWRGRIGSIVDRNGVALTCTYTPAGKLSTVTSQFGQSLTLGYNPDGSLATVTDQTTRFVVYSYFAAGVAGGNPGDLKSVSCPQLPGEAPVRGPETYTYSTGSRDPKLNSNILTATDGALRLLAGWTYSSATSTAAASYDRCVTCDRFRTDPSEPVMHFSYEFLPGSGGGAGGLLCISNNEVGSVTEMECSRMHDPLRVRNYTRFATPGIPVTSTANRPPAPVDPTEPAFLQTTFAWNPDHLCTHCTEPDGLQTRVTYARELQRNCSRRECGNALVVTVISTDASEAPRTVSMDYLPGFGTMEGGAFLSKKGYDYYQAQSHLRSAGLQNNPAFQNGGLQGEMVRTSMAGPDYLDDDDDDDRIANSPGNPIKGISVKGGRNPGGNIGAQDFSAGPDDDCDGADDDDWSASTNPIPGVGIVVKRNPGGSSVARTARPHTSFDKTDPLYFLTRLTTTLGQKFTWGHDTNGNCTSSTTPIAGSGTACTYNSLGQLTGVTVLNGPGSSFHRSLQHDAATHFLTGVVVDPDVNGTGEGLALTTTFGRNPLGLITEVVDPRNNSTLIGHNACDQPVRISSPPLGTDPLTAARVVCTQDYDPGGLPVRCDLEHRDATGALVASNPYYTGFCIYNSRGLLVMEGTEQKPVDVPPGAVKPAVMGMENFHIGEYRLDHAGQCVRTGIPAASRNQAMDCVCEFAWNPLGQLASCTTGGLGTAGAVTTEYLYSPAGQVKSASLVLPPGILRPTVSYTFDAWRRPDTFTDQLGTVTSWSYANDGFVTVEVHGKAGDVEGPGPNVLLAKGRYRSGSRVFCGVADRLCGTGGSPSGPGGSPLGMAINEKGLPGEKGSKPRKSHARMAGGEDQDCDDADDDFSPGGMSTARLLPAIQKIREAKARQRPAFFDVFVADDVWTWDRFAPGAPAPHATETTTVHHSPAGLPRSVTRNGDVLYLFGGYDTAGRLRSYSQPGAATVTNTLDACGNVAASTLTAHSTIEGTPDETFTTASIFDPRSLCTSSTDSVGNLKTMARDSLERITRETQPGGLTVTYAYDVANSTGFFSVAVATPDADGDGLPDYQASSVCLGGVCRSTTDAAGYTTTFTRDSQNRLTRTDYPDGTFETSTFNDLGQRSGYTRKNGSVVACDFDYKAQPKRVTLSNLPPGVVPVAPTEYVWNGLGHCVQSTEGGSIVLQLRDTLGNVLSETQNGHTVSHTYNHRGCTGTTYPAPRLERFSEARNAHGQLLTFSSVTTAGATPITQRDYVGFACVREVRRDGVVTTCDYRSDGEPPLPLGGGVEDFTLGGCVRTIITGPNGTVLETHTTRRNADQCETLHHHAFGGGPDPILRRQTFTLDARNRVTRCLTHVREVPGSTGVPGGPVFTESDVRYVLDARGQRLSATGGSNPGLYSSSAAAALFDHQMGQYSSWPGGSLLWSDDGDLDFLGRSTGGISLIYDGWSRLMEVRDNTGASLATYDYDAVSRRISSTVASVTTFFLYDGPDCIQELDGTGIPEMTYGVSSGTQHCIITKNGSTYYPHGSGSSDTAFVYPYLPADITLLKEIVVEDPVLERRAGGLTLNPPLGGTGGFLLKMEDMKRVRSGSTICSMITSTNTGTGTVVVERFAFSDSGKPIFLNRDGIVTGASSSTIGFRWVQPDSAWCPESGLFQCPGGLYSPELGQPVSGSCCKFKEASRISFGKGN